MTDTRNLPDDTRLPGHDFTLGEMRETIRRMRKINAAFYDTVFFQGIGGTCHAFVEFCGLQAAFIDMCEQALVEGIHFPSANTHSGQPWPVEEHKVDYLAEKFNCIYGFALAQNPELRKRFIERGLT